MGAKPGGAKGNKQEAKYRKPETKHGKPGGGEGGKRGSRKEEPGTGEAAERRDREAGNGRNRGLSSQNRKRSGRKEAERKGKGRKRKQKASTGGTAVGAKPGRTKGNEQEAEYGNREGRHERSGRRERGKRRSESGSVHRASSCKAEPGREGKEEQRLSSQNPKLKRTKERENSGGQKAERKRRQAVEWTAQRKPEAKAEGKGEPEEAAAGNEAGGRRKEIAGETIR